MTDTSNYLIPVVTTCKSRMRWKASRFEDQIILALRFEDQIILTGEFPY